MREIPPDHELEQSILTHEERHALNGLRGRPDVAFGWAMGGLILWTLLSNWSQYSSQPIPIVTKALGYIGFAFWAREWSRLGTALLLGWHVLYQHPFAFAGSFMPIMAFWVPVVIFAHAHFASLARAGWIKKSQTRAAPVSEPQESEKMTLHEEVSPLPPK